MPDTNGFGANATGQLMPPVPESTFLNTTTVKVNGQVVPSNIVVSVIRVYKAANKIPLALLSMHDGSPATQSFPASNTNIFTPGNEIEIASGYHNDNKTIFKGLIIKHGIKIRQNAPPLLEIECKDVSVKMTIDRKNKYFYNQNDTSIIGDILRAHNIQGSGGNMSVMHKEMIQFFATDWDFIVLRAEANGRIVVANDGQLQVVEPDLNQAPKFNLNYGTSIFEYEAEMDARDQYPSAKAFSWDPSNQAGTSSEMNENGPAGGGILGAAAGAVSAVQNVATQVGVDVPGLPPETDFKTKLDVAHMRLQHSGNLTAEELQAWAGAQYTKSKLSKIKGRVRFQGVADIKPGDCITLSGVGLRHEGKVFVGGVLHEISGGAWFTQVQFGMEQAWFADEYRDVASPKAGALLPPVHGLQIGVVTALAGDPENQQRIQVRLPMLDERSDGSWMRFGNQDAGNSRGAVWRPEINDEVIVGFINDDPRDGIVLGALYSSANVAPLTAEDVNHEKGWTTRSGMRLVFNDDKKSIELTTPSGKKLIVDEQTGKIQMEDENNNKVTLDSNGITLDAATVLTLKAAQSIQMEAPQIAISANSGVQIDANGQMQLSTSGDMVIRGGFVRIN